MKRSHENSNAHAYDAGQFGQHQKLSFIKYFLMLAVAGASLASFFDFRQGYTTLASVELFAAIVSLITVLKYRRQTVPMFMVRFAVMVVFAMFAVGSFTQMDTTVSLVWIPAYPMIFFFLTQFRTGLYLSLLAIVTQIGAYLAYPYFSSVPRIPAEAFIQTLSAMIFVGSLAFFYELVRTRQEQMLKSHANIDYLTNIYNRRALKELLSAEINRAQRYGSQLSFVLLDLDNFKRVNDNYGHKAGDKVLQEFCKVTQGALRKSDILARWGGEEFAILLPEANLEKAYLLADKLRAIIAAYEFESVGNITASMGISEYRPPESQDTLLQRADSALYQAKEAGKNRVMVDGGDTQKAMEVVKSV